jgi:hypothetical protein
VMLRSFPLNATRHHRLVFLSNENRQLMAKAQCMAPASLHILHIRFAGLLAERVLLNVPAVKLHACNSCTSVSS